MMANEANGAPPKGGAKKSAGDDGEAGLASRMVTVDASWLSEPPPPQEYLARDIRTGKGALPAIGVMLFVAAGGVGKSYASCALVIATATAGVWLGTFKIECPGRVLVVTAEDSAADLRRRIYHVARSARVDTIPVGSVDILDVHDAHMPLLDVEGRPTAHAVALIALVGARGPYALVVIDPMVRIAGAKIDGDNVAANALITVLEGIASAAHGLVACAHHTSLDARKKGIVDVTAIRGATGLGDAARFVALLAEDEVKHGDATVNAHLGEIVTVYAVKANHVRKWEPVSLRRGEHGQLLPLDAQDVAMVADARHAATPSVAKRKAREADRAARHTADEARSAGQRAAREQAATDRATAIDDVVVAVVVETPGVGARDLRTGVRARASCGADVADVAIARALASERIRREVTSRGSHHFASTDEARGDV